MKLLFATKNPGKLVELRALLADVPALELCCLRDIDDTLEIEENGETFAENAAIKARAAARATGMIALADDSGLEVDALGGRPGVRAARYAGPGASDAERIVKLLAELDEVVEAKRMARFRCAVAVAWPEGDRELLRAEAACEGRILCAPRGEGGFGYDPVFFACALGCTFAEAAATEKNRVSHRGLALRAIAAPLHDALQDGERAGG